jgi:hypothetical protein
MGNYFNKMSNKVRDEKFSIDLPNSNLIFTRYLYIKDEVKLALLISILNKSDDAIFWAYELYYSGFKIELFDYIWKIYYDFFATLNPSFEAYLNKVLKIDFEKDKLVSTIVQDLLIRPFNTDVFFLRTICHLFEVECKYINSCKSISNLVEQLTIWVDTNDYKSIAQFILNDNENKNGFINNKILDTIYNIVIDIFVNLYCIKVSKQKMLKELQIAQERTTDKKVVLLAKILTLFSLKEQLVKGKNFYIIVEPEDIIPYETIEGSVNDLTNDLRHYRILGVARICGIDDLKCMSLFKLQRDTCKPDTCKPDTCKPDTCKPDTKDKITDIYFNNWLYHAAFSPVWFNRIKKYRGYVDYKTQKVEFVDEDLMQMFYKKYGYEPDEQHQKTTDKCLLLHRENGTNWSTFYKKFKHNGLFILDDDELEELNNDKIRY